MAKMLGKSCWWNAGCACCNGPRDRHSQRRKEERAWRREAYTDGAV